MSAIRSVGSYLNCPIAMSDTAPKNQDALLAGHRMPTTDRQPRRGEEIWRLSKDGQVLCCELLDDSRAGAGWEVVLRRDDELIVGHRCGSPSEAHHAAKVFAQDHLRQGWIEVAFSFSHLIETSRRP